jgi:hypothetical protein
MFIRTPAQRAEGEGFEPSSDPRARNGFRVRGHSAEPSGLEPLRKASRKMLSGAGTIKALAGVSASSATPT